MPPFIPWAPTSEKRPLLETGRLTTSRKTLQDNKKFLENLNDSADENSLSSVDSEDFEDGLTPNRKRRKINKQKEDDDEVEWEDVIEHTEAPLSMASARVSGDLELTLNENAQTNGFLKTLHNNKKGPTKIERDIRLSIHRMHVQYLMFHNWTRSRWAMDKEVQTILVNQLPTQLLNEVDKWRVDSGFNPERMTSKAPKLKGRKGRKTAHIERSQRDWGMPAERQEPGIPNMSAGDPIIRLLRFLAAFWKKRFTVTAPSLRKKGYKSLLELEKEVTSFRKDKHNDETHGERIDGIRGFRDSARLCEGSRDVGAQLFTALLRGLGIETRLVGNLQALGYGWSKNEEASAKKERALGLSNNTLGPETSGFDDVPADGDESFVEIFPFNPKTKRSSKVSKQKHTLDGAKDAPIDLSDDTDDEQSPFDVNPECPRRKRNMHYDSDLLSPNYWTEVISSITHQIYPVDPLVSKNPIVTSSEYLTQFEPRGARADKAKQVFAYVIAYSPDGTAKDVTTRYLKRHVWPGRTKGVRLPVEKIPVFNSLGKIEKHEEYDWFKSVMSGYERRQFKRSAVDDMEEEGDLKPADFGKKMNTRGYTIQFYKNSADLVLERHLRRDEAIKPTSKPVQTFTSGKGDNAKVEAVYKRNDVLVCRTGESWHKEGRAVKPGEQAMKMVPIRAVTLTKKREVEEAERHSGEKQTQGLYARNQTDWIIPPRIKNGKIPKNAYGNIDCFVPTMVPKGAVHIPLRKIVVICKRLGIDYAEAVTGFEFGNKMAVPVITGVVVAEEHEELVTDQWEKDEKERKIKEEGKREKTALGYWRKWLMGLRVIQRVQEEYGGDAGAHMKEEINPFTNQKRIHAESTPKSKLAVSLDQNL